MAGTLSVKDIFEKIPQCPNHGIACVIKTGTNHNASHGKSFFICNNPVEKCSFASASDLEATVCPDHKKMVELKAFAKKTDGIRCYYRCVYGKESGSTWCGNILLKNIGVHPTDKLRNITNCLDAHGEKKQTLHSDSTKDQTTTKSTHQQQCNEKSVTSSSVSTSVNVNTSAMPTAKCNSREFPRSNKNLLTEAIPTKLMNININVEGNESRQESQHFNDDSQLAKSTSSDCSHSAFHISRNVRVSDISDSSSLDSSSSSTRRSDTSENSLPIGGKQKLSNTIEILDSSDDEEEKTVTEAATKSRDIPRTNVVDPLNGKIIAPSQSVESLQLMIKKQSELLQRVGPHAPDGGKRLQENIKLLTCQLEELRMKEKQEIKEKQEGVQLVQEIRPRPLQFPSISKYSYNISQPLITSYGQRTTTNIGYNHPHGNPVGLYNPAQVRAVPLFGGRMTETRLKDVGRITKGAIEQLHKSLDTCPSATEEVDDPHGLNVSLMTHQKQAMAWLLWREKQLPSGGILADDMGLGKTLTMVSLSLKSKQEDLSQIKEAPIDSKLLFSKCTVVVCPASLVHQWHKEIEKRVQKFQLKVCLYHGANRERRIKRLASHDLVLTTYNIVSIEGKPFVAEEKEKPKAGLSEWLDSSQPRKVEEGPLFKIFWRRIILDEGHTIKNHKTATSIAACSLEGESRWIVTGTPIQNQTMDLYSLIKFLRVSPFDELKVWKREVDNKSNSGTKRMNSIVSSILLRRTKDQRDKETGKPIVSLPKRSSILHKLKLSNDETAVYDILQKFSKNMFTQFLDTRKDTSGESMNPSQKMSQSESSEMPKDVLGMSIDDALSMFGLRGINAANAGCLLVLVLRLRQCCGHLSLMCEALDAELCKSEGIDLPLEEQLGNLSIDQDSPSFKTTRPRELQPTYSSTKITALISCLKELKEQSKGSKQIKSVIVSQWTRMLDTVAHHLKVNQFKFDFITGSVNVKKRSDIVERFNIERDPEIMLVSLKAGGVGLNLIGGSHLFLLDQHWNPALEDQACDRIYRVGQQNNVVIHRFLCVDTIEERIVQLQEKKKSLANSVLYGGKSHKLSLDDLKLIFGLSR